MENMIATLICAITIIMCVISAGVFFHINRHKEHTCHVEVSADKLRAGTIDASRIKVVHRKPLTKPIDTGKR